MDKLVLIRNFLKQYLTLIVCTPLLLGPACLPVVPKHYARKMFDIWAATMLQSVNLMVTTHQLAVHPKITALSTPTKGTLYVHLNQQTHMASLLYSKVIGENVSIVTNFEFSFIPFIGWIQMRFGSITIIRQYPKQAKAALQLAIERLRQGGSIGMSIEGMRSLDGELCPYKKGPAVLAIEAQCDIVPFLTNGEYILWPHENWTVLPGGKIDITVLPRISTTGLTYADRESVTQLLRDLAEFETQKWKSDNVSYIKNIMAKRKKQG